VIGPAKTRKARTGLSKVEEVYRYVSTRPACSFRPTWAPRGAPAPRGLFGITAVERWKWASSTIRTSLQTLTFAGVAVLPSDDIASATTGWCPSIQRVGLPTISALTQRFPTSIGSREAPASTSRTNLRWFGSYRQRWAVQWNGRLIQDRSRRVALALVGGDRERLSTRRSRLQQLSEHLQLGRRRRLSRTGNTLVRRRRRNTARCSTTPDLTRAPVVPITDRIAVS